MGQLFMEAVTQATQQQKHPKQLLFFTQTEKGQTVAGAYLKCLQERTEECDLAISRENVQAQITALVHWGMEEKADLSNISIPTFIANGDRDVPNFCIL
ncbi:hypothetical protein [Caviibacterium pharyngocola]|uniref:Uncharacterized protein n=1 Tax=Caviibacterium pharyngocola TaxID=28159 RepID=A0A2M8RTR0_9PAST|nr:hypothetical protein [Caviibacterium pharyngocola]PJG82273.1 hypothetical protein CVP04_09930 [Caviibacterium pharyngocola]